MLSTVAKNPGRKHLHMLHNVLRYLSEHPSYSICLGQKPDKPLEVYTDASWAADVDDRHSMSGGILMLAGAPIDQVCVKQPVLARSVFEAELVSIYDCTARFVHVRNILGFFDFPVDRTTDYFNDNDTVVKQVTNHCVTKRTRHIDLRYSTTSDYIQKGILRLLHCPTKDNLADFLTKLLPATHFRAFRDRLLILISPGMLH